MADLTGTPAPRWRIDRVWLAACLIPVVVAAFDPAQALETVRFAMRAMGHTGIFILFAIGAVATLKATGSEALLAKAFEGREVRMIVMAALLGGLSPFCFKITDGKNGNDSSSDDDDDDEGERRRLEVKVTRMYGCKCHSDLRRAVIEQHGVRKGWEPFGQWSLKKAQDLARKEADRLNQPRNGKLSPGSDTSSTDGTTTSEDLASSDDEKISNHLLPSMCNNGSCTWKVKAKYDNIYAEMHGRTESDDEE